MLSLLCGSFLQGLMFGYATDETEECMPLTVVLAHKLNEKIAELRRSGELWWARPDTKTQVSKQSDLPSEGSRNYSYCQRWAQPSNITLFYFLFSEDMSFLDSTTNLIIKLVVRMGTYPYVPTRTLVVDC